MTDTPTGSEYPVAGIHYPKADNPWDHDLPATLAEWEAIAAAAETTTTVAVPVELVERIANPNGVYSFEEVRALLPQPTPRLVVVYANKEALRQGMALPAAMLESQPDVLSMLDEVMARVQLNSHQRRAVLIALKHDLGVTE